MGTTDSGGASPADELWRAHTETGEPLTEDEVRMVVEAGLSEWDDWEDRGGGLFWHAIAWPEAPSA